MKSLKEVAEVKEIGIRSYREFQKDETLSC